jgi:lycopene cyclase domain-containing protein
MVSYDALGYLLFHAVIVGTLVFSYKLYPAMLVLTKTEIIRMLPVSAFFILWDFLVTGAWWQFNPKFILLPSFSSVLRLPLEEVLFFLVVPYAVLTVVKNLLVYTKNSLVRSEDRVYMYLNICIRLCLLGLAAAFFARAQWYSFSVVVFLQLVDMSVLRSKGILLGLFFTLFATLIFNMYLTALPVVMYDEIYITGIRIGSIPVEDFGYGVLLYLLLIGAVGYRFKIE